MGRKYGYKRSPADRLGLTHASALIGTSMDVPDGASVKDHVRSVLDQSITESCVAHATPQALRIAMSVQGEVDPPLPSRLQIYWDARAANGEQNVDQGTYVHSAFDTIRKLGFCPESAWPFDPANVNMRPDWQSYRLAADQRRVGTYSRITSTGTDLELDIKRAIAAKHPIVFGTDVDQAFEDLPAGFSWPGVTGQALGGHAMCAISYDAFGVEIVNSWGTSWSSGGFGRMLWSAVHSWSDIWIITIAPQLSEAA